MYNQLVLGGGEDDETPVYGVVKISIKPKSGSNLTNSTKNNIITSLKPYNVASVRPEIIEPSVTSLLLVVNAKYDKQSTSKSTETIKSEITNNLQDYSLNTLSSFDGVFRYSKLTGLIDDVDSSILSNITTLKWEKNLHLL